MRAIADALLDTRSTPRLLSVARHVGRGSPEQALLTRNVTV